MTWGGGGGGGGGSRGLHVINDGQTAFVVNDTSYESLFKISPFKFVHH